MREGLETPTLVQKTGIGRRFLLRSAIAWLGLASTVGFAYLAVRGVDPKAAWTAARTCAPIWFLPSLVLLALAVALRTERWRSLFAEPSRPPRRVMVSAYLIGQFFNNILPLRAGEAARIVAVVRSVGGSRVEVTTTVALERALDVISLFALLLACAPWFPHLSWLGDVATVAIPLLAALLVSVALLLRFGDRPIELLLRPLQALPGVDETRVTAAARSAGRGLIALRSRHAAMRSWLLTFVSWLAMSVSFWMLTRSFHLNVPFLAGILVVVATNLGQVIPSSPAAVGVFEAATLLALTAYGVDRSSALSYAVALHALNLFPYLLLGPVVLRITPVASLSTRTRRVSREDVA